MTHRRYFRPPRSRSTGAGQAKPPGASGSLPGYGWSDAATLRRTAAVVRLGRHVLDRTDLEARGLQRTDRGLAARARALHEDVDLAHAVLLRTTSGGLGGELGGEGRRLARALEADLARRRGRDDGARRVGDRDDRVVERALDVRLAVGDVLLLLAARLAHGGTGLGRHVFFSLQERGASGCSVPRG